MNEDYKITIMDQDDLVYDLSSIGIENSFLVTESNGKKYIEIEDNHFPFTSLADFFISEDKVVIISKDEEMNEVNKFSLTLEQFDLIKEFLI